MNRRHFTQTLSATLGGSALLGANSLLRAADDRDRYGGWAGKKFEATGFFRTEKDDRWWLVTPEGNAFLSFGINHLTPDVFRQPFNREAWQKKLGVDDLNDYARFAPALRSWFLDICKDYGFNTAGVHTSLQIINKPQPAIPYMQPIKFVDTPHWKGDIPEEFFRNAFARPEFIGWHYCGLVDATNLIPRKKGRQHSGLLDSYGKPYTNLEKTLKACAEELYEIAV